MVVAGTKGVSVFGPTVLKAEGLLGLLTITKGEVS